MPAESASPVAFRPGFAQWLVLRGLRGYQVLFAPMYAGSCRYLPSCSTYAREAVERHGAVRGGALAVRRLLRCHPFGGSGLDPVPPSPQREFRSGEPSDSA